jgi:uncharacterized membrane protein
MSAGPPHAPNAKGLELERLLFFSDAVFAIAITLLVLEIKLPERETITSSAALMRALGALMPKFFAFGLSFLVVGYYWIMHHTMFRHIRRGDDALLVINLVLLLCVAFLPFPVALFGSFRHQPPALVFYSASLAVTGIVQAVLWHHATRGRRLVDGHLDRHTVRLVYLRALALPAVFAVSIPLAFVGPMWSMMSWVLIAPALRLLRFRLQKQAEAEASRRR